MCPRIDHKQNGEPTDVSWLTRHRAAYLGELSRLGYARKRLMLSATPAGGLPASTISKCRRASESSSLR